MGKEEGISGMETLLSQGSEHNLFHRTVSYTRGKCCKEESTVGHLKYTPCLDPTVDRMNQPLEWAWALVPYNFLSESNVQRGPRWSWDFQVTEEGCKEGLGLKNKYS